MVAREDSPRLVKSTLKSNIKMITCLKQNYCARVHVDSAQSAETVELHAMLAWFKQVQCWSSLRAFSGDRVANLDIPVA